MKDELKDIFLMGLGAMSLTNEKAKEVKEDLLKRGNEIFHNGKVANEELKHNISEKLKENVTFVVEKDMTTDEMIEKINDMTDEEREEFLKKLNEKRGKVIQIHD